MRCLVSVSEQLTEHEDSELIPTGELLDISIAVVFVYQS